MKLALGFSPCPNDTFIFYALANRKIGLHGYAFDLCIDDVEALNRHAIQGSLPVTKVSCAAYIRLRQTHRFLRSGAAFGRGCGPLIVVRETPKTGMLDGASIAIPGELTTAHLLLRLFADASGFRPARFVPMVFHEIMPAVASGAVDAGVIIHEGRFTYAAAGLHSLMDLGVWWEQTTGLPIPLGGIIAQSSLGDQVIGDIEDIIRESLAYARRNPDEAMPYIRQHAQELSDDVIGQHISLYVNDFSADYGPEGLAALDELATRAAAAGF